MLGFCGKSSLMFVWNNELIKCPYLFKEKLLTRFEHVGVNNWVKTTILYMVTARAAAFGGAN